MVTYICDYCGLKRTDDPFPKIVVTVQVGENQDSALHAMGYEICEACAELIKGKVDVLVHPRHDVTVNTHVVRKS